MKVSIFLPPSRQKQTDSIELERFSLFLSEQLITLQRSIPLGLQGKSLKSPHKNVRFSIKRTCHNKSNIIKFPRSI